MPKLSEGKRAERRAHIVAAARASFATRGFASTSIDDICGQAGVSKGAIYVYFASKEELIYAVADARLTELGSVLSASNLADLERSLQGALVTLSSDSSAVRLDYELFAWSLSDDQLHQRLRRNNDKIAETLYETLGRLVGQANLRLGVSPQLAAQLLHTFLLGTFSQNMLGGEAGRADVAQATLRQLLDLLVR